MDLYISLAHGRQPIVKYSTESFGANGVGADVVALRICTNSFPSTLNTSTQFVTTNIGAVAEYTVNIYSP